METVGTLHMYVVVTENVWVSTIANVMKVGLEKNVANQSMNVTSSIQNTQRFATDMVCVLDKTIVNVIVVGRGDNVAKE